MNSLAQGILLPRQSDIDRILRQVTIEITVHCVPGRLQLSICAFQPAPGPITSRVTTTDSRDSKITPTTCLTSSIVSEKALDAIRKCYMCRSNRTSLALWDHSVGRDEKTLVSLAIVDRKNELVVGGARWGGICYQVMNLPPGLTHPFHINVSLLTKA